MKHYSEADLLETYYTQPGESMPVMMHLAECSECASRYERLERKVRGLAACEHDKPETFWARQRLSIMRRVQERRAPAFARYAAAAAIVLVLSGIVASRVDESTSRPVDKSPIATTASLDDSTTRRLDDSVSSDPWQSEELKDLQPVVAWESWVDAETKHGDKSL
jgi:predicted anti-sigma-YlaC factor YlaD